MKQCGPRITSVYHLKFQIILVLITFCEFLKSHLSQIHSQLYPTVLYFLVPNKLHIFSQREIFAVFCFFKIYILQFFYKNYSKTLKINLSWHELLFSKKLICIIAEILNYCFGGRDQFISLMYVLEITVLQNKNQMFKWNLTASCNNIPLRLKCNY